jgi:hypothetical protein
MLDFFGGGSGPKYISNKPAFDQFAQNMQGAANRYNPYVDTGNQARDISFGQYQRNINDPNSVQNQIASGFYMSPYQKYMQDLVAKRMNYNSANTGMLGSGAANRALQDELTKMTGQFQNEYINRGMHSYDTGLAGMGGLTELGFKALNSQDPLLEQGYAGSLKGLMSENETNQRNAEAEYAAKNRGMGNLLGFGAGLAGSLLGGGMGGGIGSSMGNSIGNMAGRGISSLFGGGDNGNSQGGFSPSNYNAGSWSY